MGKRLNPTRGVLKDLDERIEFTERALDVLERRRDVLILEFEDELDQHRFVRRSLAGTFEESQRRAQRAVAMEGEIALRSAARARPERATVSRTTRNVMGVSVPRFSLSSIGRDVESRGWGFLGSTAAIDETAEAYETLLERVARAAETKAAVLLLVGELERTVRRVNGLQHLRLPELREQRRDVARRLEERERQEIVIRKWVKDHVLADEAEPTSEHLLAANRREPPSAAVTDRAGVSGGPLDGASPGDATNGAAGRSRAATAPSRDAESVDDATEDGTTGDELSGDELSGDESSLEETPSEETAGDASDDEASAEEPLRYPH